MMNIVDISVELAVGMPQYPSPYLPPPLRHIFSATVG